MELEDSVKFIRLQTGEDLVTQVTEVKKGNEEHYYVLTNPMKVMYLTDKTGYMSVSLMQWVFHRICENQDFTIYPGDVVTVGSPTAKLIDYYWATVNRYDQVLQDRKDAEAFNDIADDYADADIDSDAIDENEGIEMIKELLEGIKKSKGTLH